MAVNILAVILIISAAVLFVHFVRSSVLQRCAYCGGKTYKIILADTYVPAAFTAFRGERICGKCGRIKRK